MKKKITASFLSVIVISTLLIIILTLLGMYYFYFSKNIIAEDYPPNFTWQFSEHIEFKNNNVNVTEKGKELLKQNKAWIQILDSNGYEIYEFYKPEVAPNNYSPATIVHHHMYSDSIYGYTIFVVGYSESDISYIVGFPNTVISKHTFEYDSTTPVFIAKVILMVLVISFFVFLIMGYIFGSRLTNPIVQIIQGVELLSQEKYIIEYEEKGVYGNVFRSLNKLTENLKISKIERIKTEKMREEWISNISHDLKTPLSSIKGYAEILANEDYKISEDEIINYSNIILNKTDYMEEMIEELRLNEKLKNNVLNLNKTKGNLTKFLREIIIEILNHPDYGDRIIHFNSQDENVEFYFDKNLMERSITNLIFNALIHNQKNTEVFVDIQKRDKIYIEIIDNGKGISEEDLGKLFNRYYRGTNTADHKGSGLGMSIAKEVIEAHGGSIAVESKLGIGTTIKIIL